MSNAISCILRAATRKKDEFFNVLTFCSHERFETGLAKTNCRFFAIQGQGIKTWNKSYAPLPANYTVLNGNLGEHQLTPDVDFDLVLSQSKHAHYKIAKQISDQLHLPLVSLEHCLPPLQYTKDHLNQFKSMRGHINVFISEFSRERWGWEKDEVVVIHHGVDTELFSPNDNMVEKKNKILSVVNDFRNRDYCCGYGFWEEVTKELPRLHIGDSPDGWSKPAASIPELIMRYRESSVFVDTASLSPIPTVVLEAMSCGSLVVSYGNAMVPEVITDGYNGFIRSDVKSMRQLLIEILKDPFKNEYQQMRERARETIIKKFSMDKFVDSWNKIFRKASEIVWTGE